MQGRARAARLHGLRRALADVARDERLHAASRTPIAAIKEERPSLHLSLPSNRVDTGPVAMTAAANVPAGEHHARAGGGDAADARHHLQDDHGRDDRARDRRGLRRGLHVAQALLHDRPAAGDVRRGAGHRRPRVPRARDRPPALRRERALHGARLRLQLRSQAAHALPVGGHGRSGAAAGQARVPAPRAARPPAPALPPRHPHLHARGSARPRRPRHRRTSSRPRGATAPASTPGPSTTTRRSGAARSPRTAATSSARPRVAAIPSSRCRGITSRAA